MAERRSPTKDTKQQLQKDFAPHKKKEGFLRTSQAKKFFVRAANMKLTLQKMTRIFGKSVSTVEKAFSYHQVTRTRDTSSDYSPAQLACVERAYTESENIETREASWALSKAMLNNVNEQRQREGLAAVTRNALHCAIHDLRPELKWGWPRHDQKQAAPQKPPQITSRSWWVHNLLSDGDKTEFLADYRKNCRLPGNSNADLLEKWMKRGCPSEDGIKHAARALGETRNRMQISFEYKTATQAREEIKRRLEDLIGGGFLAEQGVDSIYTQILEEFADEMARSSVQFPREDFLLLLNETIWTEGPDGTLTALSEIVRQRLPLEKFHEHHRYIPLDMVEKKAEWLRGITNKLIEQKLPTGPTLPGVNRFIGEEGLNQKDKDFELPSATFASPITISVLGKNWDALVINGANIGLEHDPRIEVNDVRLALAEAAYRKVDAVFIINTIDINTKKAAGPSRVVEAFFSGVDVNPKVLDPDYLERVREILNENPNDKVVYVTRQELLKDVMLGWQKIFLRPDDPQNPTRALPEYYGPIYIVFGVKEAQLTSAAAYWEIHRINLDAQSEVRAELGAVQSAYKRAFKRLKVLEQDRIRYSARTSTNPENQTARQRLDEIEGENENLTAEAARLKSRSGVLNALKSRTIITNVSDPDLKRFHRMALAHIVGLFEKIGKPDTELKCKVAGMGDTCFQIGDKKINIHVPGHLRVTDALLADFNSHYGPKVIRQEMPDLTVIAHPYALNARGGAREVDSEGIRGSAQVCVAPMCANAHFLRAKLRNLPQKGQHPVGRAVFSEQCSTGVLLISCINGIISTNPIRLSALGAHERRAKLKPANPGAADKNIIVISDTDIHIGNRNRSFTWLKERGIRNGVSEAVFHMLREAGLTRPESKLPIHILSINDDPLHGDHFFQHRQPHHHEMPYGMIQAEVNRLYEEAERTQNKRKKKDLYVEARHLALQQLSLRGIPWYNDQIESFLEDFLEPNADIFDGILRTAVRSGLVFRGVGELTPGVRSDKRDVGAINIGTGNHGTKTTFGHIAEGRILRLFVRLVMGAYPHWSGQKDLLNKLIKAPLYGNTPVGYGTVQAPGGYEWGLDFRGTPPSGSTNWSDPLMMAVRIGQRRGNPSGVLQKKMSLITHGDKHFQAYVMTDYGLYIMAPPDTPTDSFAEWAGGFPPNNTGVVAIALPAEGPDAGPIFIRPLLFDHIKRFVEHNENIDWEKFLPNPV